MSETLQKIEFNVSLVSFKGNTGGRVPLPLPRPVLSFSSNAPPPLLLVLPELSFPQCLISHEARSPNPTDGEATRPPTMWTSVTLSPPLRQFVRVCDGFGSRKDLTEPSYKPFTSSPTSSHLLDFAMGANVCLRIVHFCNFFVIDWRVVSTIFFVFIEAQD